MGIIEIQSMDKGTFYKHLLTEETPIKKLFEEYDGEDYIELLRYTNKRVDEEYAFPNDKPENQEGKPFIGKEARKRLNIFARTLDQSTTYNEQDLEDAIKFVESLRS